MLLLSIIACLPEVERTGPENGMDNVPEIPSPDADLDDPSGPNDDPGDGEGLDEDASLIEAIQLGAIAEGSPVELDGLVVTGFNGYGAFVQEQGGGAYRGIWVYAQEFQNIELAEGDVVNISGVYQEYGEQSEGSISQINITGGSWVRQGWMEPVVLEVTEAELVQDWERYESVLVEVQGPMTVSSVEDYLAFVGGSDVVFSSFLSDGWVGFGSGETLQRVRGVVDYRYDVFAVNPRSWDDLE